MRSTIPNMPLFGSILLFGTALLSTVATAVPVDIPTLGDQLLELAQNGTKITDCDISNAELPLFKTIPQLPPPSQDHQLRHVVIGRGTQNYTCATDTYGTPIPESAGAVATLYDASCLASNYPDLFHQVSELAEKVDSEALTNLADRIKDIASVNLVEGYHYFDETSTPFFDLRQDYSPNWIATSGIEKVPSPNGAVDWLRLGCKDSEGIEVCPYFFK